MRRLIPRVVPLALLLFAAVAVAGSGPPEKALERIDHVKIPFMLPQEGACVEVDVELLDGPSDVTKTLSTEILNCGDEPAFVTVEVTLDLNGRIIGPFRHYVHLGAGESLVRSLVFAAAVPIPAGTYTLCVKVSAGESSDEDCESLTVGSTVRSSVESYPNPFNAQTRIAYYVAESAPVKLEVFNLLGQNVRTLVDGHAAAGRYEVTWDGRSDHGLVVASGTYFYRLTVGQEVITRQMTLLK